MLTHPAVWSRPRLAVLVDAARRAGFGDVGLVAEPVAAAAYFLETLGREIPPGRSLVVYDLGAGTFDVSVVRLGVDGALQVVATNGLIDVGGLDLDAVVVNHARTLTANAEAWGRLDWPQSAADRQARQALWRGARAVKEQLSRHTTARLQVPLVDVELHLTREEFEKAAHPHLDRTVQLTLRTLREAGLPPEAIAGVFLVGGASRVPLAGTLLHRTLGIAPTVIDQPELVVADGSLLARPAAAPAPPPPPPAPAPEPQTGGHSTNKPEISDSSEPELDKEQDSEAEDKDRNKADDKERTEAEDKERTKAEDKERTKAEDDKGKDDERRRPVSRRALLLAALAVPVAGATAGAVIWKPWDRGNGVENLPPVQGATFLAALTGHTNTVSFLDFLAYDSGCLVSAGQDGTVRFWDARKHSSIGEPLTRHTNAIWGYALSTDGKMLVTGGAEGFVYVWDTKTRQSGDRPFATLSAVQSVAVSADRKTIAMVDYRDHLMYLRTVADGRTGQALNDKDHPVSFAAFHPKDRTILATDWGHDVRLWNAETGQPTGDLGGPTDGINRIRFSPDGKLVAAVGHDAMVHLWDTATQQQTGAPMQSGDKTLIGVAFSPDGKVVATGGGDYAIRLWNVATRTQIGPELTGHTNSVFSLAFSPDGSMLASGADDKTIRLWKLVR
ncbi:Hsp70 family protein [Dactylosporangium darangshiense]|uniref:Hsp70 family protein n=1 Tax=Dactylosporangium darangshiense TaxID=579108 RepID=UPI0036368611